MPSPMLSNQLQRARKILEALQQGLHPTNGRELPSDSIANDIDVNREMGTAILAIDQMKARMERRAQFPGNVGRSWSKEEEETLVGFRFGAKRGDRGSPMTSHIDPPHPPSSDAAEAILEAAA